MSEKLTKDVVHICIEAFVEEIVDLVKDGWAVDSNNRGDVIGYGQSFVLTMYRDNATMQAFKDAAEGVKAAPKLSRAEILVKARAARKINQEATIDVANVVI